MVEGFWSPRLHRSNNLASLFIMNYLASPWSSDEGVNRRKSRKRVVTDVLVEVSGHRCHRE
jgi:hypothetical protein